MNDENEDGGTMTAILTTRPARRAANRTTFAVRTACARAQRVLIRRTHARQRDEQKKTARQTGRFR
ncbi:hypothetical protein [Burkholderia multivorans]|uniref:hypothetical protein n=1 Tax=Burkholderia multivorans TaxID=87883 RepID=UPI002018790F|nr:hypothetical protein [Burkholderia multivorans]MCL4653177.1 hypothetical protein [Burkholderia multivorans]UQN52682.1 hypothetical protein L0Y88_00940 [Burkholderia multivorans]UQN82969.1 hypothetical protein L0Z18_27670 [Burkholderia multivorans]UQO66120.1 hypothetical protein L0Z19_00975 [Burkholderia multivorans]UQP14045.1 hypothetical protein L0Z09_15040 [Burkholderia multivorans]